MLKNRIPRVVPTLALAGVLLAMALSGAAGAASPPVGDWRMNEGSGTVLVDSSTFGNNGTIFGPPTWVAGQHGQAIRFDGTGDYATVPDSGSLDISSAITMAAWVKPEKTATQYLIKKATTTGTVANGYELSLATTGKVFVRFNQATSADTYRINSTTSYPAHATTWMHVAATYDGTTIKLYVNGVQEGGNLAGPASIVTNNLALGIGAQSDGQTSLQGAMDDVLVYNSALTGAEIAALATIPPGDPVFVGAGDIAGTWTEDTATGVLVSGIPGNVFTIGDNAYETGTAAEFVEYNNTWGAFKARTRPAAGNHDFGNGATPGATPYFDYFNGVGNQTGPAGDRALGYYSYNIGSGSSTWHVVVLNSECEPGTGYWLPGGCAAGSAQDLWLKNDLATAPTNNIIAIWHKPRWASAGNHTHMQQLWQDLYDGGADVLLGGHWHNYERLAPMDASGVADPSFGVRQFVIGTGGAGLSGFGTILPTSEVRDNATHGVMKFTLHASSYDWQFIPIAGQTFTDSGTSSTHGAPGGSPQPAVADFDGDGDTDVSVYRPSEHRWYSSNGVTPFATWGLDNDVIVPSNYDGVGGDNFAIWRPSEGRWYVNDGVTPFTTWGTNGDIPVPGNYNGVGGDDFAVYRPSEHRWYVNDGVTPFTSWGINGDIPVPGDYNGDGDTDIAVYRPSEGRWYVNDDGVTSLTGWGINGDIPVPGDYNGDGDTDFAVYRPSEGRWYVNDDGVTSFTSWGIPGPLTFTSDRPEPGDYNHDGKADVAIFRPSENRWYVKDGVPPFTTWGNGCDIQLPLPYSIRTLIPRDPACPGTNG